MTSGEFGAVFHLHYLPLCMFALRITGDTDGADDAVQEAFMATWERIEAGARIDDLRGYLYRSVRNICLTRLKTDRLTVPLEMAEEEVASEEMDTSERDAQVWRAVDALPERCREIFLLSKRDGCGNREIAERLGISVKTVENQITKAFRSLRSDLKRRPENVFFLPFL